MKRNYSIFIIMGLLISSFNQTFALDDTSQVEQEKVSSQQDSINSEFLPFSTDKYLYTMTQTEEPAEKDIVVAPKVISDKITNNYLNLGKTRILVTRETKNGRTITTTETWKTKNPSYLTVGNLSAATIATIAYVKLALLNREHNLSLNFIANLTKDFSDEERADFMNNLKNKGYWHTMYNTAHTYREMRKMQDAYEVQDASIYSYVGKTITSLQNSLSMPTIRKMPFGDYVAANHEAGHTLMAALSKNHHFHYATSVSLDLGGDFKTYGHTAIQPSLFPYLNEVFFSSKFEVLKYQIMIMLSGAIAEMIRLRGEKLTFSEFLKVAPEYGAGGFDLEKSDLFLAKVYSVVKNFSKIIGASDEKEAEKIVHLILEQCYNEAYDLLDKNKDKLTSIADELYKNKVLMDTDVYKMVGTEKPTNFLW
ncbi:MAG: hypothetical protein JO129_02470 [Candidatus Dependentiae bacterium]|nr:hypothetical protein [Candidatus Dependentiae bacterium]